MVFAALLLAAAILIFLVAIVAIIALIIGVCANGYDSSREDEIHARGQVSHNED